MTKEKITKEIKSTTVVLLTAIVTAIALHTFVYPNDFIPAGVDGICTMLQKLTKINAGWFSIGINAILLAIAFFFLNKRYTFYTLLFNVLVSGFLILLENINFISIEYQMDRIIPTLISGVLLGSRAGFLFKIDATTGGVDIIASLISKKKPYLKLEHIVSIFCYTIILISYFVYRDINSVILSLIQIFVYKKAAELVMRDRRNALEFKIVTKHPDKIKQDILTTLHHSATIVESKGMYLDEDNYLAFVVINHSQASDFINLLRNYSDIFVYSNEVNGVYGNFQWNKTK